MYKLLLSLFVLFFSSFLAAADFAVVVGPDSPIHSLERQQVANIFLSKTNRLSDGSKAKPMELTNSDLRSLFYKAITSKSLQQVNSYWTVLIFTGRGKPPIVQDSREQLIKILLSDPHTIAYLSFDEIPKELRIVYEQ